MAFSPPEYCRLFAQKKAYQGGGGGVTGTPGPPLATPLFHCTEMKETCTRGLPLTDKLLCMNTFSRSIRFVEGLRLIIFWLAKSDKVTFLDAWAVYT